MTRYPGNRWNNALIRAFRATDVSIVGESGSEINGSNPFDPCGEERYRGPLGINFIDCTNVVLRGYTIADTGNWAHRLCDVRGLRVEGVTCLGGHDAVHLRGCDNPVGTVPRGDSGIQWNLAGTTLRGQSPCGDSNLKKS